jgi:comEA protein
MKPRIVPRMALAIAAALCAASLASADTADASAGKKVNINQASAKELANLPRVGTKQAERIVEYRQTHGAFARAEDLMEVKGIGEKLFTTLKPYITLSGPTTLSEKVSSRGSRGGSTSKSKPARNTDPVGKGR